MSENRPTINLTDEQKHIFLFAYIKGNIKGIHSAKFEGKDSKKSDKEWQRLAAFGQMMHDFLCEKMNISSCVDIALGNTVEDFESEVLEIVDVYYNKKNNAG